MKFLNVIAGINTASAAHLDEICYQDASVCTPDNVECASWNEIFYRFLKCVVIVPVGVRCDTTLGWSSYFLTDAVDFDTCVYEHEDGWNTEQPPEEYDECIEARDHPIDGFYCTYFYKEHLDGTVHDARVIVYE